MLRLFVVLLAAIMLWAPIGAQAAPGADGSGAYKYSKNKTKYSKKRRYYKKKKYGKKYRYSKKYKYSKKKAYYKKKGKKYYAKSSKKVWNGGGRPYIFPQAPAVVRFRKGFAKGSIVIDTAGRKLYYVLSKSKAYRYPIAVGKPGFAWTGTKHISAKKNWPDWRPPKEMRQRKPNLPKVMTGGINNPLGAKALYLGSTLYRIHGTNNLASIGTASSSGCFRMSNGHVTHLSQIAKIGTTVHVVRSLKSKRKWKKRRYSKRYSKGKRG